MLDITHAKSHEIKKAWSGEQNYLCSGLLLKLATWRFRHILMVSGITVSSVTMTSTNVK